MPQRGKRCQHRATPYVLDGRSFNAPQEQKNSQRAIPLKYKNACSAFFFFEKGSIVNKLNY